ncbi:MAG: DUF3320 domain-containing protein [Dehalococcoidia bacterium]
MPEEPVVQPLDRFAETVSDWQRRLLQLDRRNNLLYFRPGRTAVKIIDRSPDGVMSALLSSRRGLTFDYAEPRSRQPGSNRFQPLGDDSEEEPQAYVIQGDLRGDCPPLELQRRLSGLRRRAREWQEEQGLNVLFLALGFLEWVDEAGQQATSPLLLLPCQLDRASPRDAFTLWQNDEDLTTNSTLAVKLSEFGIGLEEADSGIETAGDYLGTIQQLISSRPEWQVKEDVYLATFAYSKLAMWRDLERIKTSGTEHSIVLSMAGAEPGEKRDAAPSPIALTVPQDLTGARLDDVLDVKDQFAVLPADYSQLLAITAVRSGQNLVIHGPPGTGKSQTIANIIATLLAEGKSVLFVSEKTAALDVVKRRLDDNRLGTFCLDLHSERGNKVSVYQQLQQSVDEQRTVRQLDFDYAALAERRQHLNRVVRTLHQVRQPLGRTAFQLHGHFALLRDIPHVEFEVKDVGTLDQGRLTRILEVADRVRLRKREFQEHWTSHWRVLRGGRPSIELANTIRRDMETLIASAAEASSGLPGLAGALGLRVPESLDGIVGLERIAHHLATAPRVPQTWLQDRVTQRLRSLAGREAERQRTRAHLLEQLAVFGSPIPSWDFAALAQQLAVTSAEERSLQAALGDHWKERLAQGQRTNTSMLEQLSSSLAQLRLLREEVAGFLGLRHPDTWPDLQRLAELSQTMARIGIVPPGWVEPGGITAVTALVEMARDAAQDLEERETRLFSEFEPDVLDIVDQDTVIRYRTDHQSRLRRLISSSYRADWKAIQAFHRRREKMSFPRELEIVNEIWELQRRRLAWDQNSDELAASLQTRYAGRSSNWESILGSIQDLERLLQDWTGSRDHLADLLTDEAEAARSQELAQELSQTWAEVRRSMEASLSSSLAGEVQYGEIKLSALEELIRDTTVIAGRIEEAAEVPLANSSQRIPDVENLRQLLHSGAELTTLEREHRQAGESLQADLGWRYNGFETDWADIMACLSWTDELLRLLPSGRLSPELMAHAERPQTSSAYAAIADAATSIVQQYQATTAPIQASYNLAVGPWESWGQARFDDIRLWAEELSQDADFASDWLLYQSATTELDLVVGPSVSELIRQQTDDSALVPSIIERRVLGAWLDWVYLQEPDLAGFTTSEQEDLIAKFKELDEQLVLAAQVEVRRKVIERHPNVYATSVRSSELGILRGELSKRRRQLPVRRLFQTIPRLIQTLKPCFLVSPLAVSQYLPISELASETLNFDVVIFDEASQVFPEDAVPATLRGKQLVLAGDQKQLPPSSFWRRSLTDDGLDYDDEGEDELSNQLVGRESILDVAVGMVGRQFNEAHLNVHYRSKEESLIKFSNHHFYDDRLLTFPSPGVGDSWYGVHDVYVQDGRYDAGATRTNRAEAEQVVDMVFRHMRTRPLGETLGVVALSRSQSDLIERFVEERRIHERDVDERFNERPEEPFFVKNLENVQGDERDHMILSVGYGPTVGSGAVPNRFGPLNIAGGERRLNVVITRAKQRMDVVHSLKPSDIHSEQAGARLLRRFLEYASNPRQAFESEVTIDATAEPESPFEAAVERALVARGYRVARQVGVSGYRIDLAIRSEDDTNYDLGIECDGWTYHSAPAARDRDWLRQKVLEGLGWRIHRVWSTAWVRNPEGELARIEEELARARSRPRHAMNGSSGPSTPEMDLLEAVDDEGQVDPTGAGMARPSSPDVIEWKAELRFKKGREHRTNFQYDEETDGSPVAIGRFYPPKRLLGSRPPEYLSMTLEEVSDTNPSLLPRNSDDPDNPVTGDHITLEDRPWEKAVRLKKGKESKTVLQYIEETVEGLPTLKELYIQKWLFGKEPPEQLLVTIQNASGDEEISLVANLEELVAPSAAESVPDASHDFQLAEYMHAQLPNPARWAELRYETTDKLIQLIIHIAEVEGPVHREVVIERLRQRYGLGRVRGSTRDHVEHAISLAQHNARVLGDGTFIWLSDDQLRREPRAPVDGDIEHVPPVELMAIVLSTARAVFGAPRRELVIETARRLGFSRTSGRITEVLDRIVQGLLDEEKLTESFGMIHAKD